MSAISDLIFCGDDNGFAELHEFLNDCTAALACSNMRAGHAILNTAQKCMKPLNHLVTSHADGRVVQGGEGWSNQ